MLDAGSLMLDREREVDRLQKKRGIRDEGENCTVDA